MKRDKRLIGVFLLLLAVLSFWTVSAFWSTETVSDRENRALSAAPEFSWENLFSGDYLMGWEDYLVDHVPGREAMLKIADAYKDHLGPEQSVMLVTTKADMGVLTNSGADQNQQLLVLDDRLLEIYQHQPDTLKRYSQAVIALAEAMPEEVNSYLLLAPNRIAFEEEAYRKLSDDQQAAIEEVYQTIAPYVTPVQAYDQLALHQTEEIYFRTDHHWTMLGSYYGAQAFGQQAGFEMLPLADYDKYELDGFFGYLYQMSPTASIAKHPEVLDYYLLDGQSDPVKCYYYDEEDGQLDHFDSETIIPSLAEEGANYGVFLGGDYPLMVIDGRKPNDRVLIVVKDSYGNALLPWLTPYFDQIIAVDPRQYQGDLPSLAKEYEVTDFLVVDYIKATMLPAFVENLEQLAARGEK